MPLISGNNHSPSDDLDGKLKLIRRILRLGEHSKGTIAFKLVTFLSELKQKNQRALVENCKEINKDIKELLLSGFNALLGPVANSDDFIALINDWFSKDKSLSLAVDQQRHTIHRDMTATREKMRDAVQDKILESLSDQKISSADMVAVLESLAGKDFKFTATFLDKLANKLNFNENNIDSLSIFFINQYNNAAVSSLFNTGCANKAGKIAEAKERSDNTALIDAIKAPRRLSYAAFFGGSSPTNAAAAAPAPQVHSPVKN